MFFFRTPVTQIVQEAETKTEKFSEKIKKKLDEISKTNRTMSEVIANTQSANLQLALKLKSRLKHGDLSLKSFSEKLSAGVMILDYQGFITQMNAKGREILNLTYNECIDKSVFDLIRDVEPIDPPGKTVVFNKQFFSDLSEGVFAVAQDPSVSMKPSDILCLMQPNDEHKVKIHSVNEKQMELKFTFSVIENNPDELTDISYVIVFVKE